MANVIKLTDTYVDTSSVYDTNQSKTQADINASNKSSIETINSNYSSLNKSAWQITGGNSKKVYWGGTSQQSNIYIKVTSSYSAAHVGGLFCAEQNGGPLLAILSPSGWSTALNNNGWKCSYSAPQWSITGNAWSTFFFIPFSDYTYSIWTS